MGAPETLATSTADPTSPQTVLVADDHPQAQVLLTRFLKRMGYHVEVASNGLEAVQAIERVRPDIVLMDLTMPVMGGFEATEQIRAGHDRWIPIVFLSATPDSAALIRALERGADDYLVKPISYTVLRAKMRAVSRMLTMQRELEDRNARLAAYRGAEDEQNRMAQHVISRLASHHRFDPEVLQHWTSPASFFSGDLVVAAYTPAGVLHVMLADGAGHGLAAALSALPVTQPFYRMTEKGYSLASIATEMNTKVRQLLPVERFVAATLVAIDFKEQLVEIWNGGNPPLAVMAADGRVLHTGISKYPPLGVVPENLFGSEPDLYRYDEPCQLVACSDGLYEAVGWRSNAAGVHELARMLASAAPAERFAVLTGHLTEVNRGSGGADDATVVVITCQPGQQSATERGCAAAACPVPGDWRFHVRLAPEQLRSVDVVPVLHELASQMICGGTRNANLYLVLSELLSNALDHGLLGLDSRVKSQRGGFQRYLDLRTERLAALAEGAVDVRIAIAGSGNASRVHVQVTDSGPGFDYARVLAQTPHPAMPFGRGIPLVKRLCESVEYRGSGNEVQVVLPLFECESHRTTSRAPLN